MKLTGTQYQQFSEALRDAFSPNRLRQMLRFRLDKNLDDISLAGDYETIAFDLIGAAEMEGWLPRLIQAARESNPGNASLLAFAQQFGAAPAGTPVRVELEKIIVQANSFLDVTKWRQRLGDIEGQVCRIEMGAKPYGTGFLLGPDVVMTNYHVMEPVITGALKPKDVLVRFDYKLLADGLTLSPGTTFQLAGAWLVDSSPYSPAEMSAQPSNVPPKPDELDYALIRLDGAPGNAAVGANPEPGSPPRKWIEVPAAPYDFQPDTALFIVQHPKGAPLKLALDTDAVIGCNAERTRVNYRTNTEPGSSGSPVFNSDWELVALHHSGDPQFVPTYNQGIPMPAIMGLLTSRGLQGAIGAQQP